MTQNKIEGKFYALKPEEWLQVTKELRYAEVRVLYYTLHGYNLHFLLKDNNIV
jgi:hypothetical protein